MADYCSFFPLKNTNLLQYSSVGQKSNIGPTGLRSRCVSRTPRKNVSLSSPASRGHPSFVWGPFVHPQRQQYRVSLAHLPSPQLCFGSPFLSPSSSFKNPWYYTGPTYIIQDNLSFLKTDELLATVNFISNLNYSLPCNKTYSQVPETRSLTSLGGHWLIAFWIR